MVVGVTNEPASEVEPYLQKNVVKFPIAIANAAGYDVRGIPHSFLVDKDGKILWRGHPASLDAAVLDQALVGAKCAIVPAGLEEVQTARRARDFGTAYRKGKEALGAGTLSEAATTKATDWLREIEQSVTEAVAAADKAVAARDVYAQWAALQPIADSYQGVPGAEVAKQRVDKLLADVSIKKEIEAGRKMVGITEKDAAREFDAAYELCKELLKQHSQTKAGKDAAALMKSYEKHGKLGFDQTCSYCQAYGVACDTHSKTKKKKK